MLLWTHCLHALIVLLTNFALLALTFKFYQKRIPNGNQVINPCDGSIWEGVGHENSNGGGKRNTFGEAFANEGKTWTRELCQQDSDGDGKTNGEELGDPDCVWKSGLQPSRSYNITHPGVCDPFNRNTCKENFLKCDKAWSCPAINEPDVKTINLTLPEGSKVPTQETTYLCHNMKVPADKLYDIIASKAIIVNKDVMHHMTMYGCDGDLPTDKDGTIDSCELRDVRCNKILFIWSVGMEGFCQPDYKAFRFGKGLTSWVSIQYHWNNPQKLGDLTDSSGIQLFYTSKLRTYAEDIFQTGDAGIFIPPHSKQHKVTGLCSEKCSKHNFEEPFNISSIVLHMHATGKRIWAKQYRDGKFLRLIAEDNDYNYNKPVVHRFDSNPIEFRPGDELKVECTFNTEDRNDWTIHGPGYRDEMCVTLISYYPANVFKVDNCFSVSQRCSNSGDLLPGCNMASLTNDVMTWKNDLITYCDDIRGKVCSNTCRKIVNRIKSHHPACFYRMPMDLKNFIWAVYIRNQLSDSSEGDKIMNSFKGCELYNRQD